MEEHCASTDVESISQTEVSEAHIIFVDVQGVGKKLDLYG